MELFAFAYLDDYRNTYFWRTYGLTEKSFKKDFYCGPDHKSWQVRILDRPQVCYLRFIVQKE